MIPAIDVRNLKKSYLPINRRAGGKTVALKGIDLTIKSGEFYGLLGPNGAGKTTTIGIITGLVRLDEGSVSVMGKDIISDYRFTRSKIGVSPQELTVDWFFSIERLLYFQAGYYGIRKEEVSDRIEQLLKKFGLYKKRNSKIRELSGGMKRRFQVLKALVHDPEILILDEPTAGIDVELRHMLWDYLRQLHKEGKTILLTTHYIDEAELLCERVGIINEGTIVAEGKPSELIQSLGKGSIEVYLSDCDPEKEALISGFTYVHEPYDGGSRLVFSVDEPEKSLSEIINALSSNGCHIHEVKITKSSLEDVFVSLTGRTIND
ncbi:MAG: ABC transporter ATP-binding protein [Candidatus Marinimicrobia bacterium]|nr:ABC transporter ATP-binding protein [Candidatus Neomarinimicrobiota bacterium]